MMKSEMGCVEPQHSNNDLMAEIGSLKNLIKKTHGLTEVLAEDAAKRREEDAAKRRKEDAAKQRKEEVTYEHLVKGLKDALGGKSSVEVKRLSLDEFLTEIGFPVEKDVASEFDEWFEELSKRANEESSRSVGHQVEPLMKRLCREAHEVAVAKGWWDEDRSIPECLALIHSEVSEALEDYRAGRMNLNCVPPLEIDGPAKPVGFPSELADIVIRVFDLAGKLDINLGLVIGLKMKYNETRPYRHGGKKA